MDLAPYLTNLRDALAAAARTAGDDVQEAAERLAGALEPALRLTLLEFASELTDDITVKLDGDAVEVRLRGGQPEVVVERRPRSEPTPPSPPTPPEPPAPASADDSQARVSLRLPESLKTRIDDAAAAEGVSVNTWIVRAAQRALQAPPSPPFSPATRRMTGWAK